MAETKTVNYKRSTATKELIGLLERVKELNDDKKALLSVNKLYVFGSYIRKTDRVHDLDLFVEFVTTNTYEQLLSEEYAGNFDTLILDYADKSDRIFKSFLERIFWWREEPLRRIKGKSRVISLHDFSELNKLQLKADQYVPIINDGVIDTYNLQKLITD